MFGLVRIVVTLHWSHHDPSPQRGSTKLSPNPHCCRNTPCASIYLPIIPNPIAPPHTHLPNNALPSHSPFPTCHYHPIKHHSHRLPSTFFPHFTHTLILRPPTAAYHTLNSGHPYTTYCFILNIPLSPNQTPPISPPICILHSPQSHPFRHPLYTLILHPPTNDYHTLSRHHLTSRITSFPTCHYHPITYIQQWLPFTSFHSPHSHPLKHPLYTLILLPPTVTRHALNRPHNTPCIASSQTYCYHPITHIQQWLLITRFTYLNCTLPHAHFNNRTSHTTHCSISNMSQSLIPHH